MYQPKKARSALAALTAGALTVPFVVAAGVPAVADVPATDLVAEYLFGQSTGTSVANTAPGATLGAATVRNGADADWTGSSLVFRGGAKTSNGNWVELPDNILAGATSATVSTEVKIDPTMKTAFNFLFNVGNEGTTQYYFASVRDNTRTAITNAGGGAGERNAQSSVALTANRWYNLTSVIDGEADQIRYYIDGQLVATGTSTISPADITDQSLNTIGRAPWPDPLLKGEVAAFRVYDRALGADEIAEISDDDATINADEVATYADAVLDEVQDVTLTDTTTVLPDYDGAVTWSSTSDDVVISEDGRTAVVTQPAHGGEPVSATLTASASVRGVAASTEVDVTIEPAALPTDEYGYLMVHFIEDSAGYAEKIYLDVSRGDNPEQWDPLNGGEPILASDLGTTGVRDPYVTYNPETGTYYIIATDLRVFGGDNAGWGGWTSDYSTKVNVWESTDLVNWESFRQFDVALDEAGNPDPAAPDMEMMWAPEATWVPDYYGEGEGAFVMYWSSAIASGYHRVMWGATPDFSQGSWEFGGTFIDAGGNTIDTTILQEGDRTYRVTKDNSGSKGLYMEYTDAAQWWLPAATWTQQQTRLGAEYAGGNAGGVEGPAMFKAHGEDTWYLYADVIPSVGYKPLISTDLDATTPWALLDSPDFDMRESTKHGGIIGLTKVQYDSIRAADAVSGAVEGPIGTYGVAPGASAEEVAAALPVTAQGALAYGRGTAAFPVTWDVADVDTSVEGPVTVTGTLGGHFGANLNAWVGDGGSTAWNAPGKELYSSTDIEITAVVNVGGAAGAWSFENDLSDATGNHDDATPTTRNLEEAGEGVDYVEGVEGQALFLNGSNGVRLPDGLIDSYRYSVSMWTKYDVSGTYTPAFFGTVATNRWFSLLPASWTPSVLLWSDNAGTPFYGDSFVVPAPGEWVHLTFTVDEGDVVVYVNGVAAYTGFGLADLFTGEDGMFALGVNYGWDDPYRGAIDEVEVYSRPLSADEVWAQYGADTSELEAILAQAAGVDPYLYTAASLDALATAVTAAEPALEASRLEQGLVDDAVVAVQAALDALEERDGADVSALEAVLAAAEGVDRDAFTGLTLARLDALVSAAQELLSAPAGEQAAVDAAVASVQAGIDALAAIPSLRDIATNPFKAEIEWLAATGVTTGWATSTPGVADFRPLSNVNRDQMAAFLYRLAGEPEFTAPAEPTFLDVPTDYVFYKEIEWLATTGVTEGWTVDEGVVFRPRIAVNRDVMAAFLYRYAGSPTFDAPAVSPFVDVKTNHVFYKEIAWLNSTGISQGWTVDGDKQFRTTTPVKRDVMAAFLFRYADQFLTD